MGEGRKNKNHSQTANSGGPVTSCEVLFVECWRSGIELSVNGDKLHLEAPSSPPDDLLARLTEHKPALLRFLSCWIDTPYGEAKFWGFIGEDRCGVILRIQPDRVTWMKRSELKIKPSEEDRAAAVQ